MRHLAEFRIHANCETVGDMSDSGNTGKTDGQRSRSPSPMGGQRANLAAPKRGRSESVVDDRGTNDNDDANSGTTPIVTGVTPQIGANETDAANKPNAKKPKTPGSGGETSSSNANNDDPKPGSGQKDDSVSSEEDDPRPERTDGQPELLNQGQGGRSPFPGAGCVTVAKLEIKNRSTMYLNRYGPERYPWFVLSEQHHFGPGGSADQLVDISNNHRRVLDHPIDKEDPDKERKTFKSSSIKGLLGLVWKFDESESPKAAVEALNPERVKKADKLQTLRERSKYVQKHQTRLPTYPWTYAWTLFSRPVNDLVDPHRERFQEDVYHSWELGSKYKDSFRKGLIQKEWEVYHSAKRQAERFVQWYEKNVSASTREGSVVNAVRHKTEDRRLPTVAPVDGGRSVKSTTRSTGTRSDVSDSGSDVGSLATDDTGPDVPVPSVEKPAQGKPDRGSAEPARSSRRRRDAASRRKTPRSPSLASASAPKVDAEDQVMKNAAMEGFKAKRRIRGELSEAQAKEFEVFWDFYIG